MSAKRRLRALENVRNVQRSNGTVQEKTKDCESEVENMAKFGINDILNAKTKAGRGRHERNKRGNSSAGRAT